jgi:hypothetical protein
MLDRNLNAKHTHKHETGWTAKWGVHYLLGFLTRPRNMKSKQLANVLIKILGLSLCAQSVMHLITGIFSTLASSRGPFVWINFVSGAILAAIGISLIVTSRNIAGFLFKNEDE